MVEISNFEISMFGSLRGCRVVAGGWESVLGMFSKGLEVQKVGSGAVGPENKSKID